MDPSYHRMDKTHEQFLLAQRSYCHRHRHPYPMWEKVNGKLVVGRCLSCLDADRAALEHALAERAEKAASDE